MKITYLFFSLLLTVLSTNGNAQDNVLKEKITQLNIKRDHAMRSRTVESILLYYNSNAVCMPEFHPVIQGYASLQYYFSSWMQNVKSSSYKTQTVDLIRAGNSIIETGTFTDTIIGKKKDTLIYAGKYMRHWKAGNDKILRIEAEIWGASNYIDRARLPYTGPNKPTGMMGYDLDFGITGELKKRNGLITQLVKERKGAEHAALFTSDAIYMPYYMPMMVGIDQVRSYFTEHEKPGDVIIDSLTIAGGEINVLTDNIILEHGFYGVRWIANDKSTGVVTGKSLNLWKRNEEGVLMLWRQMVNHN